MAAPDVSMVLYSALTNKKGLKLKLDIVDTLFLDDFGDPIAWFYTDPKTRMVRCKKAEAVNWDSATEWLDTAAEVGAAGGKVFVERSRAVALLLQRDDLDSLVQQLSESTVQVCPPPRALARPRPRPPAPALCARAGPFYP